MNAFHTNLTVHVMMATLRLQGLIDPGMAAKLYPFIDGIVRGDKGRLIKIGGTLDHLHLLARIDPVLSVADMVHRVKSKSARWVNDIHRPPVRFAWHRGYAAFSVSQSRVAQATAYIADQADHHRGMSFEDELALLLEKHRIPSDPEASDFD